MSKILASREKKEIRQTETYKMSEYYYKWQILVDWYIVIIHLIELATWVFNIESVIAINFNEEK